MADDSTESPHACQPRDYRVALASSHYCVYNTFCQMSPTHEPSLVRRARVQHTSYGATVSAQGFGRPVPLPPDTALGATAWAQGAALPWGEPVWSFPIPVTPRPVTDGLHVDVAVVGAGFTGLATAHYVRQLCPDLHVAVFEAWQVGAGASGRTGGLVLEDTASGPLPGVEDCIATLQELVRTQSIACDLRVDGCWEIGRHNAHPASPIQWTDSGTVQVINMIPGGAFDPRKFLAGLGGVVQRAEGQIDDEADGIGGTVCGG